MKFQRFGNAFVARDDKAIYVVSHYLESWALYYLTPDMAKPERIGLYGYPTHIEAQQAAEEWSTKP